MNKYQKALDSIYIKTDDIVFVDNEIEELQELIEKSKLMKVKNGECPNCKSDYYIQGHGYYDGKYNYCGNCGQALDWSEDNETN